MLFKSKTFNFSIIWMKKNNLIKLVKLSNNWKRINYNKKENSVFLKTLFVSEHLLHFFLEKLWGCLCSQFWVKKWKRIESNQEIELTNKKNHKNTQTIQSTNLTITLLEIKSRRKITGAVKSLLWETLQNIKIIVIIIISTSSDGSTMGPGCCSILQKLLIVLNI